MKILLTREWADDICTIGRMWIDGEFECFTLEDPIRPYPDKIRKKTCIWGDTTYRLTIDHSPKYGRPMLHVLDVPLFTGIRIHSGNDAEDTEGCILVGKERGERSVWKSREALLSLFSKVEIALQAGEDVRLVIANPLHKLEAAG